MKFCPNCGKELKEGADICLKCGRILNNNQPQNIVQPKEPKEKGKGKGIASFILGLCASFWSFLMVIALPSIQYTEIPLDSYYYFPIFIIALLFFIGYSLFSFIPALIGFILGLTGYKQHKSGLTLTGIILCSISLFVCLVSLIKIFTIF